MAIGMMMAAEAVLEATVARRRGDGGHHKNSHDRCEPQSI
jgi:hypothetical protein